MGILKKLVKIFSSSDDVNDQIQSNWNEVEPKRGYKERDRPKGEYRVEHKITYKKPKS